MAVTTSPSGPSSQHNAVDPHQRSPNRRPLVAITGATGFIGQHLHRALLRDGYDVVALVRPQSANSGKLDKGCQQCAVELSDQPGLSRAIQHADAVVYCAGSVRGRTLADFEAANVKGIQNVMQAAAKRERPPPVLFVSSLAASRPTLSDYANSKHLGEVVVGQFDRVTWTILRPPAIYGPGDKEMRPLLDWARRGLLPVVGPSDQRISLLHVSDLVRAMQAWLGHSSQCARKVYEIHDGQPQGYDWPSIARAGGAKNTRLINIPGRLLKLAARLNWRLAGWFGYAPMLTPGKVRELHQKSWVCENEAFSTATQWSPEIGLSAGIADLYADNPGVR